jgi:2-polyprenyl-3-methyl-5-hydroxy-6-metoxy-1,4-benzoquinol methylase
MRHDNPSNVLAEKYFNEPVYLNHARYLIDYRAGIISGMLGNSRPVKILDIGCGDGSLSTGLLNPSSRLTMLDLSAPMLACARQKIPPGLLDQVDFVNESFTDWRAGRQYHTILCVGVLAHVPCVESFVSKIASLLQPGGIAVLEVTDNRRALSRWFSNALPMKRLRPNVQPGYRTNPITAEELIAVAASLELYKMKRFHYNMYLPLSRFFPQWLLRGVINRTGEGRLLARCAVENLIFFQKKFTD